jgi:hypothetical protein
MLDKKPTNNDDMQLFAQIVQVAGRLGLSMVGAMCGTFAAAHMTDAALFDSAGFVALMVLVGILSFYLGVDVPYLSSSLAKPEFDRPRIDPIELLSRIGTFLVAIAALISVYGLRIRRDHATQLRVHGRVLVGGWGGPPDRSRFDWAHSSRQSGRLIVLAAWRIAAIPLSPRIVMIVDNSRPAIRVCAMLAVSTIALGAPAALAGTGGPVSGKNSVLPRAQGRHFDCTSMSRASQVHEHVQDPFASMLLE